RMWVESRVGLGSTFHFTARLGRPVEGQAAGAGPLPLRPFPNGSRVLVVDDHATNRFILDEVLSAWGAPPQPVERGAGAVELLREGAAFGRPFAAAVLDGLMPEMNGFELAARIRSEPALAGMALVLMSSDGASRRPHDGTDQDFDATLSKPLR